MLASIQNHIRGVEQQKMSQKVVSVQRTRFLTRRKAALSCTSPLSPIIERNLADFIKKAHSYQSSVRFIEGNNTMEATVISQRDTSVTRRIFFKEELHVPPAFYSYSTDSDGFPVWHGVADICEKHGSVNVHRFIAVRHLTDTWRAQ